MMVHILFWYFTSCCEPMPEDIAQVQSTGWTYGCLEYTHLRRRRRKTRERRKRRRWERRMRVRERRRKRMTKRRRRSSRRRRKSKRK